MFNRNAKHLDGRDVLREYAHYEQQINKIHEFAFAIRFKLMVSKHTDDPWPKLSVRPS